MHARAASLALPPQLLLPLASFPSPAHFLCTGSLTLTAYSSDAAASPARGGGRGRDGVHGVDRCLSCTLHLDSVAPLAGTHSLALPLREASGGGSCSSAC